MKRLATAALLAALTLAGLAAPAGAQTLSVSDPRGDNSSSYDPRGDVLIHGASNESDLVVLGMTVAASDTLGSFNWRNGGTSILWDIATPTEDFTMFYYHDEARIRNSDFEIVCYAYQSAQADTDGSGFYGAGIDPSCLGNPAWVRTQPSFSYGDGSRSSYDMTAWTSEIYVGTPQPQPQPQPQPNPDFGTADPGIGGGIGVPAGGYWMVSEAGTVYNFGAAGHHGNGPSGTSDVEPTPNGNGYWLLKTNGEVHGKGDATHYGNAAIPAGEKAVSLSSTPSGNGYWIFTDKGRVIALGGAAHFGDVSGTKLNGSVLDSVATTTGQGYYMVASDGGIFTFGDARFAGSTGNVKLNKPVMSMAVDPDGQGYWLVASDGGIFAFDAPFFGSLGSVKLNKPVSGIVPGANGYLMVGEDGGIFSFGTVPFHGSLGANPPSSPVTAVALRR